MYLCVHACVYVFMGVCICVHACVYVFECACIYVCICITQKATQCLITQVFCIMHVTRGFEKVVLKTSFCKQG